MQSSLSKRCFAAHVATRLCRSRPRAFGSRSLRPCIYFRNLSLRTGWCRAGVSRSPPSRCVEKDCYVRSPGVLEADIKACFDEIDHTALMNRLRVRIKDKRVCGLVKAFLKAGVFTEIGGREETYTGTPQGGILSPLLANIALSALDDHFDQEWRQHMSTSYQRARRRRNGKANFKIIRYADDCAPRTPKEVSV